MENIVFYHYLNLLSRVFPQRLMAKVGTFENREIVLLNSADLGKC